MAAPVAAFIQLPSDSGNTGKKVRTQSRVIGADTVHEHFFIPLNPRSVLGMYYVTSGLLTANQTAHNITSTGFTWLINPVGSAIKLYVHSIKYSMASISLATADATAHRLAFALFTFTGTASGATQNYAKRDSNDAAPVSTLRTATTGLTITAGNIIRADLFPTITGTTGVGQGTPYVSPEREFTWDEMTVLRPGEGLCCYGPDTGVASSTVRATVDMIVEEAE